MKFTLHIKTWNRWRKYSLNSTLFNYLVLFHIGSCPSFEMVKSATQLEMLLDKVRNKNRQNKFVRRILILVSIISLLIMSAIYFNVKDVHAVSMIDYQFVEIQPKEKLFNMVDIYGEEHIKEKLLEEQKRIEAKLKELTIEERIKNACDDYGVPFNIALAIARLETGWFKSDAYLHKNNPGGMSLNEVPKSYDTIDKGVDAFISNLANNYINIGLDTPDTIGEKYCPVDSSWSNKVKSLMKRGV